MKIVFCFPYRGVGGVPVLFLNLATYFAKESRFDVYIVDFKDGYMAKNYDHEYLTLITYGEKNTLIPNDSVMIFQSMTPWSVFPNITIPAETKIIFWNLYN